MRREIHAVDPDRPIYAPSSMDALMTRSLVQRRFALGATDEQVATLGAPARS